MRKFLKQLIVILKTTGIILCVTLALILFACSNSWSETPKVPIEPPKCLALFKPVRHTENRVLVNVSIRCDKPYKLYLKSPFNNFPREYLEISDHPVEARNTQFWIYRGQVQNIVIRYWEDKGYK
jgi:hypothetical protein